MHFFYEITCIKCGRALHVIEIDEAGYKSQQDKFDFEWQDRHGNLHGEINSLCGNCNPHSNKNITLLKEICPVCWATTRVTQVGEEAANELEPDCSCKDGVYNYAIFLRECADCTAKMEEYLLQSGI